MNSLEMKKLLEARLKRPGLSFSYDRDHDKLRIADERTSKGMTLSLPGIISKYENGNETVIEDIIHHVEHGLEAMNEPLTLSGKETKILPVIRSTSFPKETKDGNPFLFEEHTAETRVYYAVDLDQSYKLIDETMMAEEKWTKENIHEMARFNLRSLNNPMKEDKVAGNTFYFINENDGYDASRILNQALLDDMKARAKGDLAVAVPHQDVLLFADLENDTGYDVLGQMTMSFFTNGRVPITALPFLYEDGELEPIFIMARKKPKT
ncbi:MAG TPA: DUF1444 domain-containing protein [Bacillales bacterium]|nr:DUF1444 domain-containing protein [Bacillales bacterium]